MFLDLILNPHYNSTLKVFNLYREFCLTMGHWKKRMVKIPIKAKYAFNR